ncbi:MAG: PIN domain-containing protein, partial [Azoarcus sp.]|nr:PIN domain-containing protein [Azoarcus sp.]
MYLIDTNVLSEIRKAGDNRADPHVADWYAQIAPEDAYLSVVTLMEVEFGAIKVEEKDPVQAARLRHWLNDRVIPAFADRILPVTNAIAFRCAPLHYPRPRSWRDSWIA